MEIFESIDDNIKNFGPTEINELNDILIRLVNSKKINPKLANDTDLVLYEIVDPFFPIEKQLQIIEKLGSKYQNQLNEKD